ncbi:mCG1027336, partial [Mus musculus]
PICIAYLPFYYRKEIINACNPMSTMTGLYTWLSCIDIRISEVAWGRRTLVSE